MSLTNMPQQCYPILLDSAALLEYIKNHYAAESISL